MKPAILAWIVVAIGILTANTAAHAPLPDLDSCHDDLDRVRREASDASDTAEDAKSKHDELQGLLGQSVHRTQTHLERLVHFVMTETGRSS